jgi:hypothetical protein
MASLPPDQRRNVFVRGKVSSVVGDKSGAVSREQLSHEEVSARMDRGEDPVVTGADDDKLEQVRRYDKAIRERKVAGEEDALVLANKATPFVGQALQNAYFGPEKAAQYRQQLLEANRATALGGDLAMLAAGGTGIAKVLGKFAPGTLTTRGVKGFGNLLGGGAAADTYLYAEYLADTNTPFRAEDYGRELAIGALFNFPIAGAAAVRGAAIKAAGSALQGGGNLLGTAADYYVTRAVLSGKSGAEAAGYARKGAGLRIMSRLGQKLRGKKARPGAVIDPVGEAQRAAVQQEKTIGKATASKLGRMAPSERQTVLDEVRGYAGSNDTIDAKAFNLAVEQTTAVRTSVSTLGKQADAINVKVGDKTKGIGGRASKKQTGAYVADVGALVGDLRTAGWSDIANYIEELLVTSKDGKLVTNPHQNFGKLVQARLDARLKRGIVPGAAQADDSLRKVIDNSNIWGTGKHKKVAKDLNKAIDDLADAQETLRDINIPKSLDDLGDADLGRLATIDEQVDIIRSSYATLERHKMLSRQQVRGIEKTLKQINEKTAAAGPAYENIAKLNKMRGQAAGNTTDRLGRVLQAEPDFRAAQNLSSLEEAGRLTALKDNALRVLNKGLGYTAAANVGGVVYLRSLNRHEKDAVFEHLQAELAAYTGAPERMEDAFAYALGATEVADPDVTTQGSIAATSTMYYLAQAMPKRRNTLYRTETPRTQKEAFLQTVSAVLDPISVAYAALEGRVTPNMVDAIRATQPAMYAEISNQLSEAVMQADPSKASRKAINGVNLFLGGVDPLYRGDVLFQLQNHYTQNQVQAQAMGPNIQGQFKQQTPQDSGSPFTFTQRLTSY